MTRPNFGAPEDAIQASKKKNFGGYVVLDDNLKELEDAKRNGVPLREIWGD
ncbi:hypothetical protein JCM16138_15140 [Thermococcus atlanticus]